MIDTSRYIILENKVYNSLEEATQQIRDCYSNLLGVTTFLENGKWIIIRDKKFID